MTKEVRDMIYEDGVKVKRAWFKWKMTKNSFYTVIRRMADSVRFHQRDKFYNELFDMYNSSQLPIPKIFIDCLSDEELFEEVSRIFLLGLMSEDDEDAE